MRWQKVIFQEKRPSEERDELGNTKYHWVDKVTSEARISPFTPMQTDIEDRAVAKAIRTFASKVSFNEVAGCDRLVVVGSGIVYEIEELSDQCPRYTTGTVKVYKSESII